MRPTSLRVTALLTGSLLWSVACLPDRSVIRVQDGHESRGRFISPDAYRAFVEGALAEAQGDLGGAAAAYERTLSEDPRAAEAWSGLGRVLCITSRDAADRALGRARTLDDDLVTPWLSAAGCELARGRPAAAAAMAKAAAQRSPGSPEATRLVAEAFRRSGQTAQAERWIRGLRLLGRGGGETAPLRVDEPPRAAAATDDHGAEAPPALRAALDRFRADPRDADARIALLVAADLAGDDTAFADASAPPGSPMDAPSPRAAARLEELLTRRVGDGAARAFREAYGAPGATLPDAAAEPAP